VASVAAVEAVLATAVAVAVAETPAVAVTVVAIGRQSNFTFVLEADLGNSLVGQLIVTVSPGLRLIVFSALSGADWTGVACGITKAARTNRAITNRYIFIFSLLIQIPAKSLGYIKPIDLTPAGKSQSRFGQNGDYAILSDKLPDAVQFRSRYRYCLELALDCR
jgi:hypothetical protein